ncbi:hypothetical protein DL95DRAFT_387042, partial [Leptodontidium sp. 2 PMI_412]
MKSGSASTLVVVVFMLLLACLQRLVLTVITNKFHQEPPPHTRGSALGRQARQDPIQIQIRPLKFGNGRMWKSMSLFLCCGCPPSGRDGIIGYIFSAVSH